MTITQEDINDTIAKGAATMEQHTITPEQAADLVHRADAGNEDPWALVQKMADAMEALSAKLTATEAERDLHKANLSAALHEGAEFRQQLAECKDACLEGARAISLLRGAKHELEGQLDKERERSATAKSALLPFKRWADLDDAAMRGEDNDDTDAELKKSWSDDVRFARDVHDEISAPKQNDVETK